MSVMLRPLALGELLDRVFQLYRSRFWLFIGIAAIAYLPLFALQTAGLWTTKLSSRSAAIGIVVGLMLTAVLHLIGIAASHAATIIVVSAAYLDQPINVAQAYRRVSGMLVRIFGIMIGMWIGVMCGFVLLIVPGVMLFLRWALALPVAVLEDAGLVESLTRSKYLTEGHRWRVVAIYLLYFALVGALEAGMIAPVTAFLALKGVGGAASAATTTALFTVIIAILGFVIECLVTPVLTIALSLMYYDERVRKEAFDIQLMMGALGDSPAESATANAI